MIGIAIWHFTILVPDRFVGGIVGAFLAAWIGGLASGFALDGFSLSGDNPPGMWHAVYAIPGAVAGLAWCYWEGVRREGAARA